MTNRRRLEAIHRLLERLDSLLIVRDPGGARSAEAYDGLRKTILATAKSRRIHVSHLVSLREAIDAGATLELISDRVTDFLSDLGVRQTSDISLPGVFEVPLGAGGEVVCVRPGLIDVSDDGTFSIIRLGIAERIHPLSDEPVLGDHVVSVASTVDDPSFASDSVATREPTTPGRADVEPSDEPEVHEVVSAESQGLDK